MKRLSAILLAFVVSLLAEPQNSKLAADLRDIEPESTLDVIVQYKATLSRFPQSSGTSKSRVTGAA